MQVARKPWSLRFARYDDIVLSPHLDDAIYSCAGTIAAAREEGRRVVVVTVFGRGGEDATTGGGVFGDYEAREAEDREAMAIVDADSVWLDSPELAFRPRTLSDRLLQLSPRRSITDDPAFATARDRVRETVASLGAEGVRVYCPLAIGFHPDHRLVFEIGRELALGGTHDVRFYEDVPYAMVPALRRYRFEAIGADEPTARDPSEERRARLGGAKGTLVVPLALGLFTAISFVHAKLRARESPRFPLVAEERVVDGQRLRKLEAIKAYRSQTPLFFPEDIESCLPRSRGALVERSFRLAATSRHEARAGGASEEARA